MIALIFIILVLMIGFVLLITNNLRNRNPVEVLLFSILIVLTGMALLIIDPHGELAYVGLFWSLIGFLIGVISFVQHGRKMSENK